MGMDFFGFKKHKEEKELLKLGANARVQFATWVKEYDCGDDTPPNEEECEELVCAKVAELLASYDTGAAALQRVENQHVYRRETLVRNLEKYKGNLFLKYSDAVAALTNQAANTMAYCVECLAAFDAEQILPTSEALLEQMFEALTEHLTQYIDKTFPDGVAGMDAYDDVLPDDLPSYAEFLESVAAKHEEFKAKNPEAIPGAIEEVKTTSKLMFQDVVNKAISAAMEEITLDLSDDTLPYLDEDQMQALRDDLIADAKEYCASRIGC